MIKTNSFTGTAATAYTFDSDVWTFDSTIVTFDKI